MRTHSVPNRNAHTYIAARLHFKGSNFYSAQVGDAYAVYSYGTHYPMFVYYGGLWYENSDKSSRSTERQRSYGRRSLPTTAKRTTEELKRMLADAASAALRRPCESVAS